MKQGIHPNYVECTVRCTCGNTWKTHSTKSEIVVDLCDKCHPFYTGTQKLVDTGGRVQRFSDKFGAAAAARLEAAKKAKDEKAAKAAQREAERKAKAEAKAAAKAKRAAEFAKKVEAKAAEVADKLEEKAEEAAAE
ncbi:MAG: 50S ribosomal protein L31 [Atopobiaceae bacterium]|nr:50S ribosomal protein L31 [Atopobiaceae bacterium]MDO4404964.1 50S ribosomal protein L31 [Atopobiaceae bacterium]